MSARRHIGNPEYLTRRIPQNPRYQHVKSRLDTAFTSQFRVFCRHLREVKGSCVCSHGLYLSPGSLKISLPFCTSLSCIDAHIFNGPGLHVLLL
ncbi:testis specific, 14, isoform CRA_b [Rattus norvegicus]|uniref:Testis specific, 14, isoform CRA_b n=2 Tax=Rattus norvegicus TaxID=10116 RepID=A6IEH5_RAT|nr:testis specific, 14, isoform CRA_b [Rattus norvegicus]